MIELPEYKIPSSRTVAIYVWEKVKDYLTKAGTTIFIASILMWIILNFGPHGYTTDMSDSFGAILGHGLVPFFAPIGLGFWQIAVALIAGISAKEVVVSSCAVLFGVSNINSGAGMDIGKCRVWTTQCVLSDDFLPTIYSMYGGSCNDTQGIRKHTLDVTVRNVSVGGGMDSDICSLSSWDFSVR